MPCQCKGRSRVAGELEIEQAQKIDDASDVGGVVLAKDRGDRVVAAAGAQDVALFFVAGQVREHVAGVARGRWRLTRSTRRQRGHTDERTQ